MPTIYIQTEVGLSPAVTPTNGRNLRIQKPKTPRAVAGAAAALLLRSGLGRSLQSETA